MIHDTPENRALAEELAAHLEAAFPVTVPLAAESWAVYNRRLQEGFFGLALAGFRAEADEDGTSLAAFLDELKLNTPEDLALIPLYRGQRRLYGGASLVPSEVKGSGDAALLEEILWQ